MPRGSSVTNYRGATRGVARGTAEGCRGCPGGLRPASRLPRPRIAAFAWGEGPVSWRTAAPGLVARVARDLGLSARE